MFERRPMLALILVLNLCVIIWRMSVPGMLETEEATIAGYDLYTQPRPPPSVAHTDDMAAAAFAVPATALEVPLRAISQKREVATPPATPTLLGYNDGTATSVQDDATAASLLPALDFAQLIDLRNFSLLMAQPRCDRTVAALILVHSAPRYFERRALIRETWGSGATLRGTPLRLVFLLGAVEAPELQAQLEEENARYADMVQGSFVDNYRNMTYKHVMALKWFLYHCGHAQLLAKVDDDTYVNTPQLLRYLRGSTGGGSGGGSGAPSTEGVVVDASRFNATAQLFHHPRELLLCEMNARAKVKRSYRSKWRVSFREYADPYYPNYCPGYVIFFSADVVFRLYTAAQQQRYFWIDDVFITGILPQGANITITQAKPYLLDKGQLEGVLSGRRPLNETEFLFGWCQITPEQVRALWRLEMANANANAVDDGGRRR